MRTAKVDVARALTPLASGILLDPSFGVPAVTEAGALAPGVRPAGRSRARRSGAAWNGEPRAHRDPALSAAWAKELGADASSSSSSCDRPAARRAGPRGGGPRRRPAGRRGLPRRGDPVVIENLIYPLAEEQLTRSSGRTSSSRRPCRSPRRRRPDQDRVPRIGQGCRRIREAVNGPWAVPVGGRRVRGVPGRPAHLLRRGRRVRLHRRPLHLEGGRGARRREPSGVPRHRRPAAAGEVPGDGRRAARPWTEAAVTR
jgi:hypothetical protein